MACLLDEMRFFMVRATKRRENRDGMKDDDVD